MSALTIDNGWILIWISLRVHRCDLTGSVMALILNSLNTIVRQIVWYNFEAKHISADENDLNSFKQPTKHRNIVINLCEQTYSHLG